MKRKLRTAGSLLLAGTFLAGCSPKPGPGTTDMTKPVLSRLSTQGNRIVDETGAVRILRGVNRSGFEYDRKGNGISEKEIAFICREWKAQIIRLPFNQAWILSDPDYNRDFDRAVGWVTRNGAYAMLDLQWQDETVKIPKIPDAESVRMWKILAGRYRDNPGVLFDIHNEAHDTTWAAWRARAAEIIEGIRSVHPGSLIFVCGLDWAYDLRDWGREPLPYDHIVYSTHPYPFKGEPWAWDKYFGAFSDSLVLYAGEFGGGEKDLEWGRKLMEYFDEKQMGWAAWSWVDQPVLTKKDRRTPTPFGELVNAALIRHAEKDI